MKLPKILAPTTRKWLCPGCNRVLEVPNRKADPALCKDCIKRERSRRRKDRLLAPFRAIRGMLMVGFLVAAGLVAVVAAVRLIGHPSISGSGAGAGPRIRGTESAPTGATGSPTTGSDAVQVRGYERKDGVKVRPHTRSKPKAKE